LARRKTEATNGEGDPVETPKKELEIRKTMIHSCPVQQRELRPREEKRNTPAAILSSPRRSKHYLSLASSRNPKFSAKKSCYMANQPQLTLSLLLTGILGAITGSTLALLRRSPTPTLFALATSLQWTLLASTYHFTRQSSLIYQSHATGHDIWSLNPAQKERASAFAGGVAGVVGGAVRGSVVNMGAGGVVFAGLGFVGEKVVAGFRGQDDDEQFQDDMVAESENIVAQARTTRAFGEKHQFDQSPLPPQENKLTNAKPGLIERMAKSRWNPMRRLTDREYEDMLKEKLIRVEAEIAIVDEEVAKLEEMKVKAQVGDLRENVVPRAV